jgi:hypothetical protein
MKIEYRVRPVTRYHVTRFEESDDGRSGPTGSSGKGEYANEQTAYEVAYALARQEHEALGWPVGDERIRYPEAPGGGTGG